MSRMLDNLARVQDEQAPAPHSPPRLTVVGNAPSSAPVLPGRPPRPLYFGLAIAAVLLLAFVMEGGPAWVGAYLGWQPNEIIPEPPSLASAALSALKSADYQQAEKVLDAAIRKNPMNATYWINRGFALKRLGQLRAAENSYLRALTIQPRNAIALNNLGLLYFASGRYPEAVSQLEKALAVEPAYSDARLNLAASLEKSDRWAEAAGQYDTFLNQANPDDPVVPMIRERARKVRSLGAASQSKEKF